MGLLLLGRLGDGDGDRDGCRAAVLSSGDGLLLRFLPFDGGGEAPLCLLGLLDLLSARSMLLSLSLSRFTGDLDWL